MPCLSRFLPSSRFWACREAIERELKIAALGVYPANPLSAVSHKIIALHQQLWYYPCEWADEPYPAVVLSKSETRAESMLPIISHIPSIKGGERTMNWYEVALWTGWLASIWAILNVLSQPRAAFVTVGRTKRKWVVINVLGLIPYLGLITASAYYFVWRRLPAKPRPIRQSAPRRHPASQNQDSEGSGEPCDRCRGRGWVEHERCKGTGLGCAGDCNRGRVRCERCRGTGVVPR
jgi:hypothetical protein